LGRTDLVGFLLGAGVALQTAIRHPAAVHQVVVVSGRFRADGEYPEIRAFEQAFSLDMPAPGQIREGYLDVSPSCDAWASLVFKMRQLLAEENDWSE
jgi:pimeloyl-ACP methyl ester carboxylesterase